MLRSIFIASFMVIGILSLFAAAVTIGWSTGEILLDDATSQKYITLIAASTYLLTGLITGLAIVIQKSSN